MRFYIFVLLLLFGVKYTNHLYNQGCGFQDIPKALSYIYGRKEIKFCLNPSNGVE